MQVEEITNPTETIINETTNPPLYPAFENQAATNDVMIDPIDVTNAPIDVITDAPVDNTDSPIVVVTEISSIVGNNSLQVKILFMTGLVLNYNNVMFISIVI